MGERREVLTELVTPELQAAMIAVHEGKVAMDWSASTEWGQRWRYVSNKFGPRQLNWLHDRKLLTWPDDHGERCVPTLTKIGYQVAGGIEPDDKDRKAARH